MDTDCKVHASCDVFNSVSKFLQLCLMIYRAILREYVTYAAT